MSVVEKISVEYLLARDVLDRDRLEIGIVRQGADDGLQVEAHRRLGLES